jgi:hypothetical protein
VNQTIEHSLSFLVFDDRDDKLILVFLDTDPSPDRLSDLVDLELLPPSLRFGGAGGVAMGRPILGRWPTGFSRFRQFRTMSEMEQAGWVSVPHYRICDCLKDYYSPWSDLAADQSTLYGSTDRIQLKK